MRKRTIIATAIAGGVVATALIVTPSFAAIAHLADSRSAGSSAHSSQPHSPSDGALGGRSHGSDEAMGMGKRAGADDNAGMRSGHGSGQGSEMGADLTTAASGTVTAEQRAQLTALAAEEKLAHDLYLAFAEKYDAPVFSRIANSEAKHLDAVRTILSRYDITDPTVGLAAGTFPTDSTQKLYDSLLAKGSASVDAAYEAARTAEKTDIADLTTASIGVTTPDVLPVYENLLAGSERHLVAFGG